MAAFAYASARGRTAASNYKVLEPLAGGGAALVQWRLETGRTHQVGLLLLRLWCGVVLERCGWAVGWVCS